MAHHTAHVPDYTNFTSDAVYAGDLLGNVWRLDLTGSTTYSAPSKIATLTTSGGAPQPVTTRPLIEVDPFTKKRYVLIGTGRLLADSDLGSTHRHTFFALDDGGAAAIRQMAPSPSESPFHRFPTSASLGLASTAQANRRASLAGRAGCWHSVSAPARVCWWTRPTHSLRSRPSPAA